MDIYDALGICGLILMAAGLYFVYPPLALIAPGVVLLVAAVAGAARRKQD